MKKRYYVTGLIVLIILLIGYHYFAASEAARQIDEAIQEQSQKPESPFSIGYSSVDVHPFSGDIRFQNFNLTHRDYIQRATEIYFDLTYFDFLMIHAGGTEYGLKQLERMHVTVADPSFVTRRSAREFKADTVTVEYVGNGYDLLRTAVIQQPLQHDHKLQATAKSFRVSQPDSKTGNFMTDSLYLQTVIPAGSFLLVNEADHFLLKTEQLTWIPPAIILDKYGFFIRGFGYNTGSIPIDSLLFMLNRSEYGNKSIMNLDLHTELFHAQAVADIRIDPDSLSRSTVSNGVVNLLEISEQFNRFLNNAEQLFGITLPRRSEKLLEFSGPATNLDFRFGSRNDTGN